MVVGRNCSKDDRKLGLEMKYGLKMWKINQPIRKWPAAKENDGRCCAKRLCHNIHKQRYAAKVEAAKIYQNIWYYMVLLNNWFLHKIL